MSLLLAGLTLAADPLPLVTVRPLPAPAPRALQAGFTKAQLIASVYTDTTVSYHPLVEVDGGIWLATPGTLYCSVVTNMLTVSYTREGFVADGMPETGVCTRGATEVPFRIVVELPKTGL